MTDGAADVATGMVGGDGTIRCCDQPLQKNPDLNGRGFSQNGHAVYSWAWSGVSGSSTVRSPKTARRILGHCIPSVSRNASGIWTQ